MSKEEIPPWLREQLVRFEQLQQSLQAILVQKQQVEMELIETERAISELSKMSSDAVVYKSTGSLFIKVARDELMKELEEKRELGNTRVTILAKQESHIRENLKEIQTKIGEAVRGKAQPTGS